MMDKRQNYGLGSFVRQNYGFGSFVKKFTRKVTKPFTKVAKKIVPKEIAGILRVAAPFMGPVAGPIAYLAGTARQTGRINPTDLLLASLPALSKVNLPGSSSKYSRFIPKGLQGKRIGQVVGDVEIPFAKDGLNLRDVAFGNEALDKPGIIGADGKAFDLFSKEGPGFMETKTGQMLLGQQGDPEKISLLKAGSYGISGYDLFKQAQLQKELAKEAALDDTSNIASQIYEPDSEAYDQFLARLQKLTPELFGVPEKFRLPAMSGGLMRTNYAMGTEDMGVVNPFQPKPTGPVLPEEDKPYTPKPTPKMAGIPQDLDLEKAVRDFIEFNGREPRDMQELLDFFDVPAKADAAGGGLMRSNYALGDMAMNQAPSMGMGMSMSSNLGSRPTAQESGLGGLPIEADMRYTGGFMPYGEVEKADDVPARLSKNEFVFTADAVRAAGGGSVQQGAKKMYDAMKQLEKQPEAKGAIA